MDKLGTGAFLVPSVLQSEWCPTALHTHIPPRENQTHNSAGIPKITALCTSLQTRESWNPSSTDTPKITGSQAQSGDKLQSETARPTTRGNQIVAGKCKKLSNRNQGYAVSSKPNSPTIASPRCPNTTEKQDSDFKSHLMIMMMEDFKKNINNSLKEIQENTSKQVEALKEETRKSLKELVENTTK